MQSSHLLMSVLSLFLMVGVATAVNVTNGEQDASPSKGGARVQLAAKMQPLLPAGTSFQSAYTGFKSLTEFITVLHVAENLEIPFDQLKRRVTGPAATSIDQAIRELDPSADPAVEVKRARAQARNDQQR